MGMQDSYLSKKVNNKKMYNTDMVTAISEKALNSQMRLYLANCNWKTAVYFLRTIDYDGKIQLFMLDKDTDESKIPPVFELDEDVKELKKKGSSIFKELDKLNLFNLQSGTTSPDNKEVGIAVNYSLGFGFRLEDGIPDEILTYLAKNKGKVDPDEFLKIITIDQTKKSVLFRQFFRNFEVVQINSKPNKGKLVNILSSIKQKCNTGSDGRPDIGPWYTQCLIGVDLRAVKHKDVTDKDVLKKIESMSTVPNPDTVFDISQLLLDLSTLQTVNHVTIEGLSPEAKGAINIVIEEYFDRLEKAGQTIFGHIVLPKPNMHVKYLFEPAVRNFEVGEDTFYYLINFKDALAPIIPNLGNNKDFEWAPLLDGSVKTDGVMAINATKFIPFILKQFEPTLNSLSYFTCPRVEGGVWRFNIKWDEKNTSIGISVDKLHAKEDEPWKSVWSFTKTSTQETQAVWTPPIPWPMGSGKIDTKYEASCEGDVGTLTLNGVQYPSYDFNIRIKSWINFRYDSANNDGWFYDHTVKFQIGIKVDQDGKFSFLKNVIDTDNKPKGVDISGWGTFISFGTLSGVVDELKKTQESLIKAVKNRSIDSFLSGLNTFTGWVMPGCRTFTFKKEGISKYGDLYTYLNYVQE